MSCVIDLASRRRTRKFSKRLSRPTGVVLPFIRRLDAGVIFPKVRSATCTGAQNASIIRFLTDAARETALQESTKPS